MLTPQEIEQQILSDDVVDRAIVTGDGYHYQLIVVSDLFEGLSKLKRQQWVYTKLKPWIVSGEMHAVTVAAWTKAEWETKGG